MKQSIKNFIRDESGLTTVEYAVAGALISLAVVAAFTSLGTQVGITIGLIEGAVTP
jgi:pilus assembly protein Flp/PilA